MPVTPNPVMPYIVANWKMNGTRAMLAEARAIDRAAQRFPGIQVAIAPPFTLVQAVKEAVHAVGVGGQDCHAGISGAFTGEISAAMLADAGADFVILGHSERRAMHGETDAIVRAKVEAAIAAGLHVILCIGETEAQRNAGEAESVIATQLTGSLPPSVQRDGAATAATLSIAYEPVWAIGTGQVPSVADIGAMHRAIRGRLRALYGAAGLAPRILYGGSVTARNAGELLAADQVAGALVGGASLLAESFAGIMGAAELARASAAG